MERSTIDNAKAMSEALAKISKDMGFLSRRLVKTDTEQEDIFMTNMVEASFYLNALSVAAKSLARMMKDSKDGDNSKLIHDYFIIEAKALKETHDNIDKDRRQPNEHLLPTGEGAKSSSGDAPNS